MDEVIAQLKQKLLDAQDAHQIDQIKAHYLGKNGVVNDQLKTLKDLPVEMRKEGGMRLNLLKNEILSLVKDAHASVQAKAADKKLSNAPDMSIRTRPSWRGSRHPVSMAKDDLSRFMIQHAFRVVDGPEIEDEYYNFDCLNVPEHHPARQDHDTFYIGDVGKLLRTHTSPVQIRTLQTESLPLRICSIGRVYRSDFDATHTPMFHQMEGLVVDKKANFSNLKYLLHSMLKSFFGTDMPIRFRPAYFPFTEPSAEVDIKRDDEWLEVLGCGMVHPAVLERCEIDPDVYQGYAFGCGIDRLAMLKYRLPDLRALFENEIDLLSQFQRESL